MKKSLARLLLALAAALASGCKSDGSPTACEQYGCDYDTKTELGIMLRNETGNEAYTPEHVDWAYTYVGECMGLWYEPDIVVAIKDELFYEGRSVYGLYTPSDGTAVAQVSDKADTKFVIRHEFVHHYLALSTGDQDKNHTNQMVFLLCAGV